MTSSAAFTRPVVIGLGDFEAHPIPPFEASLQGVFVF